MNNDRFLLEFTDGNDVLISDNDRQLWGDYMQALTMVDAIIPGAIIIADQKLDINAYYSVR